MNARLQQERDQLEQRLSSVTTQFQQYLTQIGNAAGASSPPKQSAGNPTGSDRVVSHIDVLKAVKQLQSLKDRDHWENFTFQGKETTFRDHVDMSDSQVSPKANGFLPCCSPGHRICLWL